MIVYPKGLVHSKKWIKNVGVIFWKKKVNVLGINLQYKRCGIKNTSGNPFGILDVEDLL